MNKKYILSLVIILMLYPISYISLSINGSYRYPSTDSTLSIGHVSPVINDSLAVESYIVDIQLSSWQLPCSEISSVIYYPLLALDRSVWHNRPSLFDPEIGYQELNRK